MARILIADDSPQILQALRKALEEHPEWEVCAEASNGIEAVAQPAALNPDVVVLDLTMPKMNGFEAARTKGSYDSLIAGVESLLRGETFFKPA
jgi:DNA-binding NarL/FixJ family response regulator